MKSVCVRVHMCVCVCVCARVRVICLCMCVCVCVLYSTWISLSACSAPQLIVYTTRLVTVTKYVMLQCVMINDVMIHYIIKIICACMNNCTLINVRACKPKNA